MSVYQRPKKARDGLQFSARLNMMSIWNLPPMIAR